ncbi:hypothetical protein [Bradyrhizobium sp. Bra64]|uniref:hypothetical protein n=1 Tax=Bradyrhizobium sp. Bra64 TaxID=2926009 RepID=UPI0021180E64|nr:hypothetical protein [Bradyrhizobium sp. Bra64]
MGQRTLNATLAVAAFCAGTAVSFFTLPLWVMFAINFAREGARADWFGFFGSVIGACVTLIAAIIAWFAVQRQIRAAQAIELSRDEADASRKEHEFAEARVVAGVLVTQTVHAAAALLFAVRKAIAATTHVDQMRWDTATDKARAQVEAHLLDPLLRDIAPQLKIPDRLHYLMIVHRLSTIVSMIKYDPGIVPRHRRLDAIRQTLQRMHHFVKNFDEDLADVYERDGIKSSV